MHYCVAALEKYTLVDIHKNNDTKKKTLFHKGLGLYYSEDRWWDLGWQVSVKSHENGTVSLHEKRDAESQCLCRGEKNRLEWRTQEVLINPFSLPIHC